MRYCDCHKDTCTICTFGFDPADFAERPAAFKPEWVYLINLKSRPDRLAHALDQCSSVGLTPRVFEAVDGRRVQPRPAEFQSGSGALGCRDSHVAVLAECLRDGVGSVMVLEDDVRFADDFAERYPRFMAELPHDWQAAFLGGQHLTMPSVVTPNIVRCGGEKGCHRTHAYVVRGAYLKTLHDLFAASNVHIDWTWGGAQRHHVGIYAPTRWLAYQAESRSDINGRTYDRERRWEPRTVRDGAAIRPAVPAVNIQKPKGCTSCGKKGNLR